MTDDETPEPGTLPIVDAAGLDATGSVDEDRAAARAPAQRQRADAEVLRMRAGLARDEAMSLQPRIEQALRQACASLDAALASVDTDVEAAKDDLLAARLLIASALLMSR